MKPNDRTEVAPVGTTWPSRCRPRPRWTRPTRHPAVRQGRMASFPFTVSESRRPTPCRLRRARHMPGGQVETRVVQKSPRVLGWSTRRRQPCPSPLLGWFLRPVGRSAQCPANRRTSVEGCTTPRAGRWCGVVATGVHDARVGGRVVHLVVGDGKGIHVCARQVGSPALAINVATMPVPVTWVWWSTPRGEHGRYVVHGLVLLKRQLGVRVRCRRMPTHSSDTLPPSLDACKKAHGKRVGLSWFHA